MPLSTVSGILTRIGLGSLIPARAARTAEPLPAPKGGGAPPHRCEEAGADRPRRSPPRNGPRKPSLRRSKPPPDRLGIPARLHRRRHPARLRRGARRRESDHLAGFLARAVAFYSRHGIQVERVMTDNGPAYLSIVHTLACKTLGLDTYAPAPTGPEQTAKQNASSAPCSPAGPTPPSTATPPNAATPCPASSTSTIAADHTEASTAKARPSASTRSGTTCSGPTSRGRI